VFAQTLTGPVVLAFSQQDPGAAARVVKEFIKTNKKLTVKGVAIGGRLYGAEELERISKMPTRDEAISMLMSVMKAPITNWYARWPNLMPNWFVRSLLSATVNKAHPLNFHLDYYLGKFIFPVRSYQKSWPFLKKNC
jgi:ribosomal protein L10